MKSCLPLIWLFFLLSIYSYGQSKLDSLHRAFESTDNPIQKSKLAQELAISYFFSDKDTAIYYGNIGVAEAEKTDSLKLIGEGYNNLGITHLFTGQNDVALNSFEKVLQIARTIESTELMARGLSNIGTVYGLAGDNERALQYHKQSMELIPNLAAPRKYWTFVSAYNNVGYIYLIHDEIDSAHHYLYKAYEVAKKPPYPWKPNVISNLALLEVQKQNYQLADSLIDLGLEYTKEAHLEYLKGELISIKARKFMAQENYEQAIKFGEEAYGLLEQGEQLELVVYMSEMLNTCFAVTEQWDQAYYYSQLSKTLQDSLDNDKIQNRINLFERDEKTLELELISSEKALLEEKAAYRQSVIYILFAIMIIAFLLISAILLSRKKIRTQREKLRELSEFKTKIFAIISHDMRAPVATLQSVTDLLDADLVSVSEIKAYLPETRKRVHNIQTILDNLLHWSKSNLDEFTLKPEVFNPSELVEGRFNTISKLYPHKDISLKNNIPPSLELTSDPNLIVIILRNLLTNALKFSYDQGIITASGHRNGDLYDISIRDEGQGMDEEKKRALFSHTTGISEGTQGESGSGLGLILCKDLVERLGGDIYVNSEPGRGTTIHFSFKILE